ncbi:MAG TPA: alpha/beta hydrolase domain-containing protein [Acetobacteraceae bacterium]
MSGTVELHIAERRPFADGHEFAAAGGYERLAGRAHFAVDPAHPANAGVVDLDKAPLNQAGRVEFAADLMILKPVEPARGNRRLFFDYGNRGHKRALQFFNDALASNDPLSLDHAGNGFLMRRGYVIAWLAWEGDLLPGDGRMVMDLPVATDHGRPITGLVRVEYIIDQPGITTLPLSGKAAARSYPTVSLDTGRAHLTRRRYPYDPRIPVPPDTWCFARTEGGRGGETGEAERAIIPSDSHIHLPAGFQPGWIYELVYTAHDPLVQGLGHVAVRDFVGFLKQGGPREQAEELLGPIERAYAWGRSQTGRCLRDFVYRGFNADAAGRRVFDGVMPHVAGAGRKWLNHRFAGPIVSGGQQYEDHFNPADSFPFSYAWSTDHLTGRRDAILKRPETDPLVMHTQTATEYWNRRGSLVHTDTKGNDLPQPETVRIYAWASSQHFADPRAVAARLPACQSLSNIVATSALFRALLDAMDRWVTDGTPPPASRVPTRADGTLIGMEEWRRQFPAIPGIVVPASPNRLPLMDFGETEPGILTKEPPDLRPGQEYPILVPAVDADGNEVAGVRAPMVAAPLGTYTGWNPRARGFGHGALYRFEGSYIPFPETGSEREAVGDPRPAILERYGSPAAYTEAIGSAARALAGAGLLLAEDVERCIAGSRFWGRPRHAVLLD